MKKGKVFVVFCIDTEGPLKDPNYKGITHFLENWKDIDKEFLSKMFSQKLRFSFPDSKNGSAIFTWFMLNWTGFRTNPVSHDFGYHKVFDHYKKKWGAKLKEYGDEIAWHYHHPSLSGIGNEWGLNWFENREYENVLCRLVIDREFFPLSYRSGGTIEDDTQSNWLEQWIPFDYSNRNCKDLNWEKEEADGRKIKDILSWKKAPPGFTFYHPSAADHTKEEDMRRFIVKSLDIQSGAHVITKAHVEEAFEEANKGKDVIFSGFEHDYRDHSEAIVQIMQWLNEISKKTHIDYFYTTAAAAVSLTGNFKKGKQLLLSIERTSEKIIIKSNKPLFNPQPFLAIKYSQDLYRWLPMFKTKELSWEYNFIKGDSGKKMGVAAHDQVGNTFVDTFIS